VQIKQRARSHGAFHGFLLIGMSHLRAIMDSLCIRNEFFIVR
jgi:hypothetical protein